jgi:hypothetical protein
VQSTTGAPAPGLLELAAEVGYQPAVAAPPWWPAGLPSPELTAAVLVGTLVLAAVSLVVMVRVVVPLGIRIVRALRRLWRRVTPKSTFGKVMVIFAVLLVVVIAPTMFTLVDAKGSIRNVAAGSGAVAEMEGDAIDFTAEMRQGDASDGGATVSERTLPRPSPDRDGDRLLDSWERAGETPDGVPLPNASVGRKDIYLQVLYGKGIEPLSTSERATLRRIWARMPVANPDGSTGISIHIVDERRLDHDVETYEPDGELIRSRYDRNHLRGGECVYYQTTFGEITHPTRGGRGALNGYVSFVDGTQTTVRAGQTDRVVFLTHELLHNTAGRVEGRPHTESGWLAHTYDGTEQRLTAATAAELEAGFAIGAYEERRICGD